MRTTLNIDDDVMAAVRSLARERGISLGDALSELARRALRPRPVGRRSGLPVFDVENDAPLITPEMVAAALDEA